MPAKKARKVKTINRSKPTRHMHDANANEVKVQEGSNDIGPHGSQKRIVRLVGVLTEDVEDDMPITVEVALRDRSIVGGRAYLGFQGTLKGELMPFVLFPDGRLDFGVGFEKHDSRYSTTNLLNKEIEIGSMFTTTEFDRDLGKLREFVYLVKKVEPL